MDEGVQRLAQRIVDTYQADPKKRLLVAIAGRPGSGKSTLATPLCDRINELSRSLFSHDKSDPGALKPGASGEDIAICVGLDGWHFSRAQLDTFDDPKDAHWRRGAPFTFDLESYSRFVCSLRSDDNPIPFPTFDHAAKDPAPSPQCIEAHHRVVIIEGLYTMYDAPGWRDCARMMDLRVWLEVPRDVVFARVVSRNVAAGIVSAAEARERVEAVDMANGDEVAAKQYCPDVVVHPIDAPRSVEAAPSS